MSLSPKKKKKNLRLPPGTIVYTGQKHDIDVQVTYTAYNPDHFEEERRYKADNIKIYPNDLSQVQWYDIRGLHDLEVLHLITNTYGMHPIALENAVDVHQRPVYQDYRYWIPLTNRSKTSKPTLLILLRRLTRRRSFILRRSY